MPIGKTPSTGAYGLQNNANYPNKLKNKFG